MSTTMPAAQVSTPNGDWEVVERDIPEPGPGHVRVKVEACGMCHSDVFVKEGLWPGLQGYRASSASPALCGNCRSLAKTCFSSCRTRSRLRPRTSPMSWRLCGSYASRP
jgi:hypothetical protein